MKILLSPCLLILSFFTASWPGLSLIDFPLILTTHESAKKSKINILFLLTIILVTSLSSTPLVIGLLLLIPYLTQYLISKIILEESVYLKYLTIVLKLVLCYFVLLVIKIFLYQIQIDNFFDFNLAIRLLLTAICTFFYSIKVNSWIPE